MLALVAAGCSLGPGARAGAQPVAIQPPSTGAETPRAVQPWRAVHLMAPGHGGVPLLRRAIAEKLAPMGVNVLILEVNYNFPFASHPELRGGDLTRDDARDLAATCRKHHIRLIPMLNALGHQSWARTTFPLLLKHPEFDETPTIPKDNPGIYCRSWCPLHPDVNRVVSDLIDELIDAFQADAFHVGMDEVFLIGESGCPRCKGKDRAELFARAVNDLHAHIVGRRKLTMLMWADRLLDDAKFGYGKWEASRNGTAGAIDRIPKDIILCDWHYETRPQGYASVAYLEEKGFRMMPATWWNKDAALAMLREARAGATERMIGHLCTTWVGAEAVCRALLDDQPAAEPQPKDKSKSRRGGPREIVAALQACMEELQRPGAH
jgi:hypothetical protein